MPDTTLTQRNMMLWLFAALLLPRLFSLFLPIIAIDESIYAVFGQEILHGALPYRDLVDYKSPIIFYLYAAAFALGGDGNMAMVHGFHLIITGATAWTLFQLTRFFADRQTAFFSALLFLIFSACFTSKQFLATNAEPLMVLPLSLAALFLFRCEKSAGAQGWWLNLFCCGIALSISFLFKYTSGINLAITGFFLLLLDIALPLFFKTPPRVLPFLLKVTALTLGFVTPLALLIWYFYAKGALDDLYFWGWAYNKLYITQGKELLTWDYFLLKFILRTGVVALAGLLIWVLGFKTIWIKYREFKQNLQAKRAFTFEQAMLGFVVLWFLGSFIPVSMGGRLFYHYYVQLIVPLCVLAAVSFAALWKKPHIRGVLVAMCVIPLVIFMIESHLRLLKKRDAREMKISQHVRQHATPEDRIFVWGYLPQIYYFSGLRPASRFVFCQFLTGSTPKTHGMDFDPKRPDTWPPVTERVFSEFSSEAPELRRYDTSAWAVPRAWDDLFSDLEKNQPLYFIDTAPANIDRYGNYPLDLYPKLQAYVDAHYQLEISIDDVLIYRRKKT